MSWKIDPAHSQINFGVKHMMITNVHGRFENFSGQVNYDPENPFQSSVEVSIDAASIDTREAQRDGHLKSPDFLDAAKYPALIFRSKTVEVLDETHGRIHGELTIKDVTKPVVLEVEYSGSGKNPFGMTVAGFTAKASLNRKDWGLNWNVALETGGWLVGDIIKVDLTLELFKEAEAVPV